MSDTEQQPQDKSIPPLPFTSETHAELPNQWTISKLSDLFMKGLPAIAGLTAIFAVAGYVIVHLSLGRYTDIQPYTVLVNQYVSAGFSAFIVFSLIVIPAVFLGLKDGCFQSLALALIIALIEAALIAMILTMVYWELPLTEATLILALILAFFIGSLSLLFKMIIDAKGIADAMYAGAFSALLLVVIFIINVASYTALPRSLGGGYPARIQLLFEDADFAQSLNLPMVSDKETDEICLLAELTDGYLIYDPSQEQAFVIKYDLVTTIHDTREPLNCNAPSFNSEPTPNP